MTTGILRERPVQSYNADAGDSVRKGHLTKSDPLRFCKKCSPGKPILGPNPAPIFPEAQPSLKAGNGRHSTRTAKV